MLEKIANVARFHFHAAQMPEGTFSVAHFRGSESLSELYHYTLHLVSAEPDLDLTEVVGQPATFIMLRSGLPVRVHGVVVRMEQEGFTADRYGYQVELRPRLWRLVLSHQSRIFQEMTVPEIVTEVLKASGFTPDDFRFDLKAVYPTREYCVQYQETDLAFVSRLLEHEGIYYYFAQQEEHEQLVLTDHRSSHPFIDDDAVVHYGQAAGMVRTYQETVQACSCLEQMVTGQVVLKDYNYRTPENELFTQSQLSDDMPGVYYEYGQHYKDADEGERLARVRSEEITCNRRVVRGRSDCAGLSSGFLFTLAGHFRADLNTDFLVTRVEHEGSQRAAMGAAGGNGQAGPAEGPHYSNTFTCIPAATQYRAPRRTPKPTIPGLMTARVESAGGPYAYLDDQGRYRAKMHFDLSDQSDGTATRPLRMAQPYSGPNYGVHFPNHAGTELVWACVDGDVDRPLALGTVPNPSQASPAVASNRMQNVIRTWGQNELTFDDQEGAERIYLRATKDHIEEVTNDQQISVGHDRTKAVANNQSEQVGANKSIQVTANHDEHIGGNMTQFVGQSKAETVTTAKALSVGGAYQVSVGAAMNETVGAAKTEEVGAGKVVIVGLGSSEQVGKVKQIEAGERIELVCGEGRITIEKDGKISIQGTALELTASGPITINGEVVDVN